MRASPDRLSLGVGMWTRGCFALCIVAALAACGGDDTPEDGGSFDGSRGDGGRGDASVRDAGRMDGMVVDPCAGVTCEGFEHCVAGSCMPYASCVSDAMCMEMEICRHRFCLPYDSDPDGDGSPALDDCDETNPDISPLAPEVCNGIDDNCNMMADEGDPGLLCAMDPSGGECMDGSCGCPPGVFDIDRDPANGCECMAMPLLTEGTTCADAIDLGSLSDVGQTVTISGNVLPDDREVWYRFRGVDSLDTTCDNYHVRAQITTNPSSAFGMTIFRGDCATPDTDPATPVTDYVWATDLRLDIGGRLTGECPCTALGGPTMANVSACQDDSADYLVRITRIPGTPVACAPYTLEITNGVYDWM